MVEIASQPPGVGAASSREAQHTEPGIFSSRRNTGSDPARGLSETDERKLQELKKRDRAVRAHERAHQGAAGSHARGGPKYSYETGPDGRRYAVGGEVGIDTSKVPGDPRATIQKMRVVQRAALAPADPSPQDRRIASQAARTAAEAQRELRQSDPRKQTGSLVDVVA